MAVVKGTSTDDNIRDFAEIFCRPRTGGDFKLYQNNSQPYQEGNRTSTRTGSATSGAPATASARKGAGRGPGSARAGSGRAGERARGPIGRTRTV